MGDLILEFFDARHGDAFLVRWADQVMLVDGGPSGLYDAGLREKLLARLPVSTAGIPRLDTVVLSHVDDDHAAGLVRLLEEVHQARREHLPEPVTVGRLWFNAVEELVEQVDGALPASVQRLLETAATSQVVASSYHQGRAIRDEATALGLAGNPPFGSPLVSGASTVLPGLVVTVVAPDQVALEALAEKWREARARSDPDVLAAGYTDRSIPNLSSLVLHVEHLGRTALLTGDARGDRILAGLEATGLLAGDGVLRVDLLKVPHHGSINNIEPEFFGRIVADHYVISADGVRHHHPDEETLEALVASRDPADAFTVHLTNQIDFASATLTDLQVGRAFTVHTRAPDDAVVRVEIG